ncbi:MAG: hypothetical protein RRC34_13580 [Lentisphaeria bacterium]|nr:hypothetical protein [Lentisphaeria bacterium]
MRRMVWLCSALADGLAASQTLAVSLDYQEVPPAEKPAVVDEAVSLPTSEEGDAVDTEARRNLIISPAGAAPAPLVSVHGAGDAPAPGTPEGPLKDLDSFVKMTETTLETALPVIEAGQLFLKGIGGGSFEFIELEAALREVLEQEKERQRAVTDLPADMASTQKALSVPESGVSLPIDAEDGAGGGAAGGGFGVMVVLAFVVVLGAGMLMKG